MARVLCKRAGRILVLTWPTRVRGLSTRSIAPLDDELLIADHSFAPAATGLPSQRFARIASGAAVTRYLDRLRANVSAKVSLQSPLTRSVVLRFDRSDRFRGGRSVRRSWRGEFLGIDSSTPRISNCRRVIAESNSKSRFADCGPKRYRELSRRFDSASHVRGLEIYTDRRVTSSGKNRSPLRLANGREPRSD